MSVADIELKTQSNKLKLASLEDWLVYIRNYLVLAPKLSTAYVVQQYLKFSIYTRLIFGAKHRYNWLISKFKTLTIELW